MAKKYTKNIKLEFAYQKVFSNLNAIENIPIHNVIILESGDNLPKSKMKEGKYPVYGGGGTTDNRHNKYNISYETVGIGRVGARCGCIFEIKLNSWVTDNALYIKSYDVRFYLPYLKHFLSFSNLNQYANNAMQPVISKTRIKSVTIPLLEFDKQKDISLLLDSIELEKDCSVKGFEDVLNNVKVVDIWKELVIEVNNQQRLLKELRQSVLQDAIEGKLTTSWRAQNLNVESASVLLEKIEAKKEELIKDKKIKKGKKQPPNEIVNHLLNIPDSWTCPDLDDITQYITDGTHQTPTYTTTGRIFLSAQNVKPFIFKPQTHRYVSEKDYQSYIANKFTEKGDLLLGRVGAGIGETAVVDIDLEFAIYVSLGLVKTFKQYTNSNYLAIVFNSPYGVKYAKGNVSSGGGSAGNFNLGRIRSFPIPLPSLKEQNEIVKKIDVLFRVCDDLEEQINSSKTNSHTLMQSVLKEAFEK